MNKKNQQQTAQNNEGKWPKEIRNKNTINKSMKEEKRKKGIQLSEQVKSEEDFV